MGLPLPPSATAKRPVEPTPLQVAALSRTREDGLIESEARDVLGLVEDSISEEAE